MFNLISADPVPDIEYYFIVREQVINEEIWDTGFGFVVWISEIWLKVIRK
ncbi:hypothetical protein KB553_18560 [Chryseobacterium rhizoplanae]|nr:hypothetical protein [Chryseobacterium rhizoplanae]UCA59022.1 hypothetical protein KB553_18560 [Chryseobacterium rhizoplanae]